MRLAFVLVGFVVVGCDYGRQPVPVIVDAPPVAADVAPKRDSGPVPIFPVEQVATTYRVVGVIDGDTIDVLDADNQTKRIRFNGIDTPEAGQPFGNNAKQFVSDRVFGRDVELIEHELDRYGRTIADVIIDGENLNRALVAAGLAWHYKRYSDDEALAQAERDAQAASLGLWSDPRHVAPWDWRKLSKEERDKLR
jgi:endonuclease YncB( thermonuclease family)